ncbi:MAG: caspase family protein, partial [Prochloron sp. SP5CPC1]|nr:caspase family protein [Candidatus Paraprochloron terpiosi SP5CPC1]
MWYGNRSADFFATGWVRIADARDKRDRVISLGEFSKALALLVGINQYPAIGLNGCVTDVELQRELLVYRFGFLPEDILILKDAGATQTLIETAIDEHLVAQAKAGDVVVFHFSGYGSQVKVGECPANSLVPIDGISEDPNLAVQNPILLDTLTLLGRSLATDKVTMVLDTSYGNTDQLLRGNLRVRSCPRSAAELTNSDTLGRLPRGEHPGIILAAAGGDGVATEVRWNGFSAGLFTSALTQVLWQSTERSTVRTIINRTAEAVEVIMGQQQQPNLLGGEGKTLSPYYLPPLPNTSAAGIITAVENDTVELQLLGLSATVLSNYGLNSCFVLSQSKDEVQLQIWSREGIKALGRMINPNQSSTSLEVGQLVRESIRVLPRNVSLTVALDSDLTRIERVDATSAFSGISFVSSLIAASDQAADFLLGRVKEDLTGNGWPNKGGYRLYSVGGLPISNTAGVAFEAVKSAIERLRSKLETLLAAKLWRLTVNEGSSRLSVQDDQIWSALRTRILNLYRQCQR